MSPEWAVKKTNLMRILFNIIHFCLLIHNTINNDMYPKKKLGIHKAKTKSLFCQRHPACQSHPSLRYIYIIKKIL